MKNRGEGGGRKGGGGHLSDLVIFTIRACNRTALDPKTRQGDTAFS